MGKGGKDPDRTPEGHTELMEASRLGNAGWAQELLWRGADKDATNENGETALILASQAGSRAIVQALLEAGADTEVWGGGHRGAAGHRGQSSLEPGTALTIAIQRALRGGRRCRRRANWGTRVPPTGMPFMPNAWRHEQCVQTLLKAGADPAALVDYLGAMKVTLLKVVLGALGLPKDGRKAELVARLEQAL